MVKFPVLKTPIRQRVFTINSSDIWLEAARVPENDLDAARNMKF